jgi:hypothetical protein
MRPLSSALRLTARAHVTVAIVSLLLLLSSAPTARAIEAADGRVQLHGFGEVQMRALSNGFREEIDLAQWYNVLNLELELDIAPDGFGPMSLVEGYMRVEGRYDCVWTRGCGMMRSADSYGNRAKRLPPRLSDAKDPNYAGVIPPSPPGRFNPRISPRFAPEPRLTTGDIPRNPGGELATIPPKDYIKYDLQSGELVNAFPDPDDIDGTINPAAKRAFLDLRDGRLINPADDPFDPNSPRDPSTGLGDDFYSHAPIPGEGFAGFDALFAQRGADNVLGTDDDPGLYTFGPFLGKNGPYSFAQIETRGAPGSAKTLVVGPWLPKNEIQANGALIDRANPFRGAFAITTGAYRGNDPLDPRLQELKDLLLRLPAGNVLRTRQDALTVIRAGDATNDSFAGDFSGVLPCIDPTGFESEEQRLGNTAASNCYPNLGDLLNAIDVAEGNPGMATRDPYDYRAAPLSNVRIAFDDFAFGGGRSRTRPGGAGELPLRSAPDLSNLTPSSGNPGLLRAQGLYYPSPGLVEELSSGRLDPLDFNYSQLERSFNRGQSQDQTGELKEAYLDIEWLDSRLWTRIGKQNIVWGKTELFRTTDQFNPQDLALASLPSLEESRIALWAFRAVYSFYNVGPLEDLRVEFAANFDEFQPADLGAAGEPFTPDVVGGLTTGILFHSLVGVGVAGIDRPDNPWDNIKGLEVGGRIEWRWDRFSFALTDFYGFNDFPYIDRIWTYQNARDLETGRPLVGRNAPVFESLDCVTPALDRNGDMNIDETRNPNDPVNTLDSVVDSRNPLAARPLGIGAQGSCLKPGGEAGFENMDDFFLGAENALQNHPSNQQIFAWICNTTIGIGAQVDAGSCAFNIFGSAAPVVPGTTGLSLGEFLAAYTVGEPSDSITTRFGRVIISNQKQSRVTLRVGGQTLFFDTVFPLASINRDPGPANPACPTLVTDADANDPFVECARWDGTITATFSDINAQGTPLSARNDTTLLTGDLLTQVNDVRNLLGQGPLPAGPTIDGMVTGLFTSTCLNGGTPRQRVPLPGGALFFPGIQAVPTGICMPLFEFDPQDSLTLDSALSNFQKALIGCGPFHGTRCDSSKQVEAAPAVAGSIPELNDTVVFEEGGGIDFLLTEGSVLEQSWPGVEGTAPGDGETAPFWLTMGRRRQPGTAFVEETNIDDIRMQLNDPDLVIHEQDRQFGPVCTRPTADGRLVKLPGCRGIERIKLTREVQSLNRGTDANNDGIIDPGDPNEERLVDTPVVTAIAMTFEEGYLPSVDGCVVGNTVQATGNAAPIAIDPNTFGTGSVIGRIGGVDVTFEDHLGRDAAELQQLGRELNECHASSLRKEQNLAVGNDGSVFRDGSGWLWHPLAGCLSESRAGLVETNLSRDTDGDGVVDSNEDPNAQVAGGGNAFFGSCGQIVDVAGKKLAPRAGPAAPLMNFAPGSVVERSFAERFVVFTAQGGVRGPDLIADFDNNNILDIQDEFLGRFTRVDCDNVVSGSCEDVDVSMAQLFQNEMAAFSWNFMTFLVVTSCTEADNGADNIGVLQECYDPRAPLAANKCSFNAPHLCSNVAGFLSVAGVTRNSVRAGGNSRFGRRTFVWHSGGEIALRYEKRNVFGFSMDFAEDVTKSNWGVEFTWIEGLPFTDADSYYNTTNSDAINLTVSVDRPTFVNFLNANRTFFINSQWFFQYVPDYADSFTSNGPLNVLFTFAVFTGYFQDRLLPTFVSVFDVNSRSGGFLPNVGYRFTEAFSATIGVNIFFGRTELNRMPLNEIGPVSNRAPAGSNERIAYQDGVDNLLSLVRRRDEVYLRLRWTF